MDTGDVIFTYLTLPHIANIRAVIDRIDARWSCESVPISKLSASESSIIAMIHTWKNFFIHVATICFGLLVAIGLEQSIE